jgi:putative SOS response-associated peptidase YedK
MRVRAGPALETKALNAKAALVAARRTYNARSETAREKPSFRDAWRRGQHCLIPAEAIYEPDWRCGKAVATRISRADGKRMGIAGRWTGWKAPDGTVQLCHAHGQCRRSRVDEEFLPA